MPRRRIPAQSFDALDGHGDGLAGLRARSALAFVLLSALVLVVSPLAWASPPDQGWLPGIYDEADYDDVVGLFTDWQSASARLSPVRDRPALIVVGFVQLRSIRVRAIVSVPAFHPRSPPIA
jgi:hypothetical protein